jgi:hypothetical protein
MTRIALLLSTIGALAALGACGAKAAAPTTVGNHDGARSAEPSIHAVDFLNRTYAVADGPDAPPEQITVVKGDYERPNDADGDVMGFFHVDPPTYGDVDGDGAEDAIVITVDNTGGTGMFDEAEVWAMRGGKPVQIAGIPGGDRGDGGLHAASAEPGGVRVERYQSGDGDGACCPSKLSIEHWRWTGKDLALDEKRTETIDNPDAQK